VIVSVSLFIYVLTSVFCEEGIIHLRPGSPGNITIQKSEAVVSLRVLSIHQTMELLLWKQPPRAMSVFIDLIK